LLDTYSGAAVAYSAARRLSSTYTGSLIRVRRSSDNAEQDIGYNVNNVLDESALTTFVGANNGFVVTIYDQSGNGKNATQATAIDQPQIVVSGAINKLGTIPYIDTLNKNLSNTQINTATQSTFSVFQLQTTGNTSSFLLPFLTLNIMPFSAIYAGSMSPGSSTSSSSNFGSPSYYSNNTLLGNTRGNLFSAFATGTTKIASTIGGGNSASNRFLQYGGGFFGNFRFIETVIYNTNQSSNRVGIVGNMNTFYIVF
jgi:hypothetical protein